MGLALQIILSIIGFFAFVGFVIYQILISQRERKLKGVRENAPCFKNFARRDFTDGYFEGRIIRELPRKNKCHLFEFMPTDIETREGKKRPAMRSVVIHRDNIRRLARGSLSGETEQIFAIGNDPSDIPQELKENSLGKYLEEEGQLSFLKKTFGMAVPQSQQALSAMMKEWTGMGVIAETLANLKERNRELEKLIPQSLIQREGKEVTIEKK